MGDLPEYELAGIETIARGICIREGKILLCKAKGGSSTVTFGNGAGGGGRVALWYRRSEFGDVNPTNVFTVSAAGGAGLVAVESDKKDGLPGSIYVHQIPGLRVFVR